jgi:vacuolar-type H+-ATPase subunit E/Vma4
MGRRELLEALQREGAEAMAAITSNGAAEEERLRTGAEERREELRREHEQQRELLCSDRKRTIMAGASREASLIRLRAEHALSLRLHERAHVCLKQLPGGGAERIFHALAAELPALPWHTIRIPPGDAALASAYFPDATIIPDETVAVGLKAATADGSLTVDNTLETRLEKMWPDLLPQLMAELRGHTS